MFISDKVAKQAGTVRSNKWQGKQSKQSKQRLTSQVTIKKVEHRNNSVIERWTGIRLRDSVQHMWIMLRKHMKKKSSLNISHFVYKPTFYSLLLVFIHELILFFFYRSCC